MNSKYPPNKMNKFLEIYIFILEIFGFYCSHILLWRLYISKTFLQYHLQAHGCALVAFWFHTEVSGVLHWYCACTLCLGLLHCALSWIGSIYSHTLRLLFPGNVCAMYTSPTERVSLLCPSILLLLPISYFFSPFTHMVSLSPTRIVLTPLFVCFFTQVLESSIMLWW